MANRRYLQDEDEIIGKKKKKLTRHSVLGTNKIYVGCKISNLVVPGFHEGPLAIQLQIGLQIVAAVRP